MIRRRSHFHGTQVTLYRSRLLAGGARYEALASVALETGRSLSGELWVAAKWSPGPLVGERRTKLFAFRHKRVLFGHRPPV